MSHFNMLKNSIVWTKFSSHFFHPEKNATMFNSTIHTFSYLEY